MGFFACSGPGAPFLIAQNTEIGFTQAKLMAGMLVLALLLETPPRRWVIPAALALLLAFHPAWTVSAIAGDCGDLKRDAAYVFTALGVAALLCQVGRVFWEHLSEPFPGPPH